MGVVSDVVVSLSFFFYSMYLKATVTPYIAYLADYFKHIKHDALYFGGSLFPSIKGLPVYLEYFYG